MSTLSLQGIHKSFASTPVLRGIDLSVADGEFIVFVGPSGCGKSTLLRCIAGLEQPDQGEIAIDGRRVNETDPARRGLAMVFQSYALYPHMTVAENMSFGLRLAGTPKAELRRAVAEAAEVLQLTPLLARRPAELSGGQRQRVAIGRAIVRRPGIFLFDEPLSNLDASLRTQMRVEMARLHASLKATILYVTHDQAEAMTLADRIVVFNKGRVEQVGAPLELYRRPANLFVAGFLGSPAINLLPGRLRARSEAGLHIVLEAGAELLLPLREVETGLQVGAGLTLGLRPELLGSGAAAPGDCSLEVQLQLIEHLGDVAYLHAQAADGRALVARAEPGTAHKAGSAIRFHFSPAQALLFDAEGQRLDTTRSGSVPPDSAASEGQPL